MSAFIVNDSIINKIVTWFHCEVVSNTYLQRLAEGCGVPVDVHQLAQAMKDLNYDGVNQRYDESNKPERITYHPVLSTLPAVYKALQCWLYQCTEGDVPERAFYKFFDQTAKLYLADQIISLVPEYKDADWN